MSDARTTPPSFDELVGLIETNFKDVLRYSVGAPPERIEKAWERYKTLNHLYQAAASQPPAIDLEKIPFDPNRLKAMEGHEERAEKSWEEIQKRLAEPPAVKGAVWVKASKRLPKNTIHKRVFHAKYKGEPELLIYIDSKWHWYEISAQESLKYPVAPDSWSAIEWLDDESPTAAGDGKEDAVAFGDWIGEQNYKSFRTTKHSPVEWFKGGRSDRKAGTTAQLYDIFKQQNK